MAEAKRKEEELEARIKEHERIEAEKVKKRKEEEERKAAQQLAVRRKMEEDNDKRLQDMMDAMKEAEKRQQELDAKRQEEAQEKSNEMRIRARDKMDYIERKRRAVEYSQAVEKKKIADQKQAEAESKQAALRRQKALAEKRKEEKMRMDILREKMEQMKITKKFEIPAGYEIPKPPPEEEAGSDSSPRCPPIMPLDRGPPRGKPRSAGISPKTVSVYNHWGDQMRKHQASQAARAKKGKRAKKTNTARSHPALARASAHQGEESKANDANYDAEAGFEEDGS